jgi:hypothetical protein
VEAEELAFVEDAFPLDALRGFGFVDGAGRLTAAFDEARDLALVELPDRLTAGEKLALLERLTEATAADGVLTAEEFDALSAAARTLALASDQWRDHMDALLAGGRVRREV